MTKLPDSVADLLSTPPVNLTSLQGLAGPLFQEHKLILPRPGLEEENIRHKLSSIEEECQEKLEGCKEKELEINNILQHILLPENIREIDQLKKDYNVLNQRISAELARSIDFGKRAEEEYKSLKDQIESLLPSAMTAGLAATYASKSSSKWLIEMTQWSIFLLPLLFLAVLVGYLLWGVSHPNSDLFISMLRVTIGFPLLWISWVGQRLIFQNKRIKEEYFHKKSVMDMYVGLIKETQVDKNRLTEIVLDTVSHNPSNTIQRSNDFLKGNNKVSF